MRAVSEGPTMAARRLGWALWVVCVAWAAGCATPASGPRAFWEEPAQGGWGAWFGGDEEGARAAFGGEGAVQGERALGRWGRAELWMHEGRLTPAAQEYARLLREDGGHPLARWAALRLWELREHVPAWQDLVWEATQGAAPAGTGDGALAWRARLRLEAAHRRQRASGEAGFFDGDEVGFVQRWRVVGPLSVLPTLDFDARFEGMEAAVVAPEAWEREGIVEPTRALALDEPALDPAFSRSGIYVAEAWVEVEGAREWLAVLESEAGLRLEVDGQEILRRDVRAGYPQTRLGAKLALSPGLHRVRLWMAVTAGNEQATLLLAPKGEAGRVKTLAQPPASARLGEVARLDSGEGFFAPESLQVSAKATPMALWLASLDALSNGDAWRASVALERLRELAPEFGGRAFLEGNAARLDPTLPEQERQERAVASYREALAQDPSAGFARDRLAFLLFQQQKVDEALPLLRGLEGVMGDEYIFHYHRYQMFQEKGWAAQARSALSRALELNPTQCSLVEQQWGEWGAQDRWPAPEALPAEWMRCDATLLNLAQGYDLPRGDVAKARERVERLVSRNPRSSRYLQLLAALEDKAGRREEASRLYEAAAQLGSSRFGADQQEYDARLALDPKAARGFLERKVAESPGSLEWARALAQGEGKAALDELRLDGRALVKAYLQDPLETDTSAVYLLDYAATRVFEDGASLTLTHNIIRVQNKEGIDAFGEVSVPDGATLLQIRTLKPDGRALEPEFIAGKPSISMPNLEPGDFIEFEYLEARERGHLRLGSYQGFRFFFQVFDAPLLRSEYILETPADWALKLERRNGGPAPVEELRGRWKRARFLVERSPQGLQEPGAVPSLEVLPWILASHKYGWADLHRVYRDRLLASLRPSPEVREQLRDALAGVEGGEEAKARALFRWVKATVTDDQSGPFAQPAAQVLASGQGDRLVALSALLSEAGIKNEVVLVRTQAQPQHDDGLPEVEAWSYPLLRAWLDGREVWLDPSIPRAPFGQLPPVTQGCAALRLGPLSRAELEGERPAALFVQTPTGAEDDRRQVELVLSVDEQGDLVGEGVERYAGSGGAYLRQALASFTDEDKLKEAFAQSLGASFPEAEVESVVSQGLEDDDAPVALRYRFKARGWAVRQGDALRVERAIFPDELGGTVAGLAERQSALLVLEPARVELRVEVRFPQGWAVTQGVEALQLEGEFGAFARKEVEVGVREAVGFEQRFFLPIQRVAPGRYGAFRAFARAVDEGQRLRMEAAAPR